jgi:uncharacterized membrane protein YdjX (TVP38/TMEM64 family)
MAKKNTTLKLLGLLLFFALAYYIGKHTDITSFFNREVINSFGALAPIIYILIYTIATTIFVPGTILTLIGALLFGTWLGTLYTVIGATCGATAAFFVARFGGRDFIAKLLKGKFIKFDEGIEHNGFNINLIFRLIPIFPFNALNFAFGLTKIKVRDYIGSTFLGIIPGTFIYTYLFATVGEKIITEGFSWSTIATRDVLLPVALFILLIIVSLIFKKKATHVKKKYTKN